MWYGQKDSLFSVYIGGSTIGETGTSTYSTLQRNGLKAIIFGTVINPSTENNNKKGQIKMG